jgi:hypothetical protein
MPQHQHATQAADCASLAHCSTHAMQAQQSLSALAALRQGQLDNIVLPDVVAPAGAAAAAANPALAPAIAATNEALALWRVGSSCPWFCAVEMWAATCQHVYYCGE